MQAMVYIMRAYEVQLDIMHNISEQERVLLRSQRSLWQKLDLRDEKL
jgi:hypothetical protein